MADYTAELITHARIADDHTSVRISFAARPEPLTLAMDWRLASELIDKLAIINNEIRHALSAPDTRAVRVRTGCHRTGIALAALLFMPVLWGLWRWAQGALDVDGWKALGLFLLASVVAYGAAWLVGWIIAGFFVSPERPRPSEPQAAG